MKFNLCLPLLTLIATTSASNIHIALRQQNLDYLYSRAWSTSEPGTFDYLKFWSEEQIRNLVSPPKHVRQKVIQWLTHDIGINSNMIQDRGDSISIPHNSAHAYMLRKEIPNSIQEYIDIIIGLDPPITPSRNKHGDHSGKPDSGLIGREVIERLYNVSSLEGSGIDVGVVQYSRYQGFSQQDVNTYQYFNGIKVKNVSHTIGKDVGKGGEGELDIQMIANLQNANLWFISIDGWIYDFAVDFFTWEKYPTVLSHSYGWAEDDQCMIVKCNGFTNADYIRRTNTELAKIALKGVTMMVSSGDAGSPGRTDEGCSGTPKTVPVYPSSSPWIVSVGATYVVANNKHYSYNSPLCKNYACSNGTTEIETYFTETGWTSGAGFGIYSEPTNKWQIKAVQDYLNSGVRLPPLSSFNRNGRAYPDISIVGHNCAVFIGGMLLSEDGTSCSSPIMAALVGYISKQLKTRLGVFAPALYKLYYQQPDLFNDVTIGRSQCTEDLCCSPDWGFEATKGWDVVSGLGTPNIDRISEELRKFM